MWLNEICSSKIGPINIWRILFTVELGQSQMKSDLSLTDNLVLDVEGISKNCLSGHIVLCGGMRFAAVRLDQ